MISMTWTDGPAGACGSSGVALLPFAARPPAHPAGTAPLGVRTNNNRTTSGIHPPGRPQS